MRLNRLNLIRYGRFDGAEIVLPRPAEGNPDVTVIYGPNESGKSTAFHGFLELLFGMKAGAHPYAFKFERNDLLVGAELGIPGRGATILRRNGKRTQSLLDDQDRPVEDAILSSALHGLGLDDYVERFSLNDKGLREGGERIAGAKGDLGQLLHAGVSGLTNMADTLREMTARAEQFHKKGGRSTSLKTGKDRLAEIGRAMRVDRLTPERERALRKDRDTAQKAYNDADAALAQARKRQAAGKAAQVWYDRTEDMRETDEALSRFPDGPDLKPGTLEQIAALVTTISEKTSRIEEADGRIARHVEVIAANEADPVAANLAVELAKLDQVKIDGASLTSRADTARSDLEKRTGERDDVVRQMEKAQATLRVPDVPAASLALPTEDLESLANAAQACQTTEAELKAARDVLKTAREQLGDAPPEPQDLSELQVAFGAWQKVADLSLSEQALEAENARLAKAVSGLPTSWPKLIENGLPARETLDDILREWSTLTSDIASASADFETREAEYKAARAKREADEGEPSSIDAAATEETRRLRDAAWQSHRSALSDETANRFEDAMYADDGARTNFLMGTEARQKLANSRALENTTRAVRDTTKAKLEKLIEKRDTLSKRIASNTEALGLSPDAGPASFTERYSTLLTASEIAAEVANAEKAVAALSKRQKEALKDLSVAARLVEIKGEESDLPARVHKALALQDSVRQAWEKWRRGEQGISEYEKAVSQAETKKNAAITRLETLTAALPLPDRTASGIKTALSHLRTLQQLHTEYKSLAGRVEALERAVQTLGQSTTRLAETLQESLDPEDNPLLIIDRARTRVSKAAEADRLRGREEERLAEESQSRKRAIDARDEAQSQLDKLFEGQGGTDLLPMERASLLSKRDGLRAKHSDADKHRNETRDSVDGELFDEELTRLPDATREAELQQELDDAQEARDRARDESFEKDRLYREAYNAADNSDFITEQATILEELRNGARRAAVAQLGVLAARGALKRLAAERRSTMLQDVEEAFVAMTSQDWEKVEVWSQTEGEKLVGVKTDGNAVPVESMSTGTMGQLYFALRLAGYRSFARDPGPLPMILDDILETFDDTRAAAALHLCAEIGRSGQAIIFTHHVHLVELARKSIPGVSIVDMPN
ncbi:hypothetical protein SIAM614_29976 [Stappia aggregata IAM 12614]|uniref:YhaN AAA domain-containing protein n=1 Tax=Roseibium aggregatum (strain ATCC 25650 / DSM 13394 / JCM 20685 / NBRC 16684 / NCIMB 2208 / IAM 12614 / B1) TaxID=384765 RepID=A0P1W7_ROSAI|nr:AAA family ATPase [Roseibium aggregatum]EAV41043.1 hypothetical protein SIAM614_29976 [Stappia aggregata IAM 12614] [Roseibium aggregatum IAM 12614]